MVLPNAFLLGAAKCGTTSLTHWLSHNSDVCIAKNKEPLYFNTNQYANGDKWYSDNHYQHYQGEKIIMDNTTMHLMIPFVPARIKKSCGHLNPKFIVIAREPVERAYSHWWMHHTHYSPGYARETFAEAIEYNFSNFSYEKFKYEHERMLAFDGRYDSYIPTYIEQGLYWHNGARYARLFGADSMMLIPFEVLKNNPEKVMDGLCKFLDIEPSYNTVFLNKKQTKTPYIEDNTLQHLYHTYRPVKKMVDNIILRDVIRLSEDVGIDFITKWGYDKL